MMVEVPLDPSGNLGEMVGWFGGRSYSILAGTSIYVIYTIYYIYTIYKFIYIILYILCYTCMCSFWLQLQIYLDGS